MKPTAIQLGQGVASGGSGHGHAMAALYGVIVPKVAALLRAAVTRETNTNLLWGCCFFFT